MHLRLTQKLTKKIKENWPLPALEIHPDPLADWSCNLFTANRTQYIILCNTACMFSCLMYGRGLTEARTFIAHAQDTIREALEDEGLGPIYQDRILPASSSVLFGKALNRQVTGSMNDQIVLAKDALELEDLTPYRVADRLNENLLSAFDYVVPRKGLRKLCSPGKLPPNVIPFPGLGG